MRHRSRPRALRRGWLALALLLAAPALAGAERSGTHVTVTVTDLRSARGVVMACMSPDPGRFLDCKDDPRDYTVTMTAGRQVELDFPSVAPGRYAIALVHDENGNGKIDRALGLMPTEGYGFSRDAKVKMGPPSFKDAVIEVSEKPAHFTIRMRYML